MQPSSHHYPGSWSWGHVAWGAWISQVCSKSSLTVAQTEFGERNILLPQGNTTRVMHIRHRNPSCHGHRIWRLPAYLVQGGVCLSFCSPSARTAQVLSSTECSNHRIENSLDPPAGWSDFRILSSPLGLYFSLWAVSTYPWISGLNQNLSFSQEDENSGKKKKKNSLSICRWQTGHNLEVKRVTWVYTPNQWTGLYDSYVKLIILEGEFSLS